MIHSHVTFEDLRSPFPSHADLLELVVVQIEHIADPAQASDLVVRRIDPMQRSSSITLSIAVSDR